MSRAPPRPDLFAGLDAEEPRLSRVRVRHHAGRQSVGFEGPGADTIGSFRMDAALSCPDHAPGNPEASGDEPDTDEKGYREARCGPPKADDASHEPMESESGAKGDASSAQGERKKSRTGTNREPGVNGHSPPRDENDRQ